MKNFQFSISNFQSIFKFQFEDANLLKIENLLKIAKL